jgi:uncharacterized protein YjiK
MRTPIFLFAGFLLVTLTKCGGQTSTQSSPTGYDLSKPQVLDLDPELNEISGICLYPVSGTLLAINDETGTLYELDPATGKILRKQTFHKDGDYEDVAYHNGIVYVMKSNGNIYRVENVFTDSMRSTTYKFIFDDNAEFESLYADSHSQNIILTIKDGNGKKGMLPAFGFSTDSLKFITEPLVLFDPLQVQGNTIRGKDWRASATAKSPITGNWFVISAVKGMMLETDNAGKGLNIYILPMNTFAQPEGICFLPNGDMLISNEAKGLKPTLVRIPYSPVK